jgi:hypothetical protein
MPVDRAHRFLVDRVHPGARSEADVGWAGLKDALDVNLQREGGSRPPQGHLLTSREVALDPPGFLPEPFDGQVREVPAPEGALDPATLERSLRSQDRARPRWAREQRRECHAQLLVVLPARPISGNEASGTLDLPVELRGE